MELLLPRLCFVFGIGKDADDCKARLRARVRETLCRRNEAGMPLEIPFTKLNQVIRGRIGRFRIGSLKKWEGKESVP